MTSPDYIYTTYIKSTPQKVWQAITNPEFQKQYFGFPLASDWKPGSAWRMENPNSTLGGKVLESKPPEKLVFTWAENDKPELGTSKVTYEITQVGDTVRLMVLHDELSPGMASRISTGWPRVISSMKSLLETGAALDMGTMKKGDCAA
jgi:uncharacterized protein YndB with AHSA1/START domain